MRRGLAVLVTLTALACEAAPVDPATHDPTSILIVSAERLEEGDTRTVLENQGGAGHFRLVFLGPRGVEPPEPCAPVFLAETDTILVDSDYAADIVWQTGELGLANVVIAVARPLGTTGWSETSRVYIDCEP